MTSASIDYKGAEFILEVWPAIDSVRGPVPATFLARAFSLTTALAPLKAETPTFMVSAESADAAIERLRRGITAGHLVPFNGDIKD